MNHEKPETYLFVLRIWFETREMPDAAPLWRVSVRNTASGEIRYFDTAEKLVWFLETTTGGVPPDLLSDLHPVIE